MHVQRFPNLLLGDAALSAGMPLFFPDFGAYHVPALAVRSPSAFPRRVIFKPPIFCLPFPEAVSVAKELSLTARYLQPNLPRSQGNRLVALSARHLRFSIVIRPSLAATVRAAARVRAEVDHADLTRLQFYFSVAMGARTENWARLRRGVQCRHKPRAATHRTKAPALRSFFGEVRLERENRPASGAGRVDSFKAFHAVHVTPPLL